MRIHQQIKKGHQDTVRRAKSIQPYLRLFLNLLRTILPVVAVVLFLNGVSIMALEKDLENSIKSNLTGLAEQGAQAVGAKVKGQLEILETLSDFEQREQYVHANNEILSFLHREAAKWGFEQVGIADPSGMVTDQTGKTEYIGDRAYFKMALEGKSSVSDPLVSRMSGNLVVAYAVPELVEGKVKRIIIGTQDAAYLNKLIKNLSSPQDGNAFIKDSQGYTIAHDQVELVQSRYNPLNESAKDASLAELVALERQMQGGASGAGEYHFMGQEKYLGYAPIPGTQWYLAVAAPKASVFKQVNRIVAVASAALFAIAVVIIGAFAYSAFLTKRYRRSRAIAGSAISEAGLFLMTIREDCSIFSMTENLLRRLGTTLDAVKGREISDFGGFSPDWIRALASEGHPFLMKLTGLTGEIISIRWYPVNAKDVGEGYMELLGVDISETDALLEELNLKNENLEEQNIHLNIMEAELKNQMAEMESARKTVMIMADRYRLAAGASRDVIWDWDGRTNESFISDRIFEILGDARKGMTWNLDLIHELIHPEDIPGVLRIYSDHLKDDTPFFSSEFRITDYQGQCRWIHVRGIAIKNSEGRVIRTAGSLADVSEQKQKDLKLHQLAYYDALTGLPNVYWVKEKLGFELATVHGQNSEITLYCLGLDELKRINDLMGNSAGDAILLAVAARLVPLDASSSEIARIGGDEFLILRKTPEGHDGCAAFAERLIAAVREPVLVDDVPVYITCSVGMASHPKDGGAPEELLKNAEMAMRKAKETGKNTTVHYDMTLGRESAEKTQMSQQLRSAVSNQEFFLMYQPKVWTSTREIRGYEALLRWNSPVYGVVPPSVFIPLAEENGAIIELGMMVLKEAFAFIRKVGRDDFIVSCNISARQLMQRDFVETFLAVYREADIPKGTLAFEITESALLESLEEIIPRIRTIRDNGIPIYLDDFGTGYSSLTYLNNLPIDVIKIDKTFVQDMMQGGHEEIIIRAVINMAHQMDLKVVAEGVETEEQLALLESMGCDQIQGYYFSRPVSEKEALDMLDSAEFTPLLLNNVKRRRNDKGV